MRPLLASIALLVACGSDSSSSANPAAVPSSVATLASPIGAMVLVGTDLLCATDKAGIVRVATATGQAVPYAASERASSLVAAGGHVAWVAEVATGTGPTSTVRPVVKVAPAGDASAAVTLADDKREVHALAIDDGFVYWAEKTDVYPNTIFDILRAPVTGGAPTTLATAVKDVADFGMDASSLWFTSGSDLVSMPKIGGTPQVFLKDATGLGGAANVRIDDAFVTYVGATGGGATSSYVESAPRGGGAKSLYAFGCQGIAGMETDAANVYATCNTDIQGFKTTPNLTIKKATKGNTSAAAVIGQMPQADASDARFGAVAVDGTSVYVAYGSSIVKVAK